MPSRRRGSDENNKRDKRTEDVLSGDTQRVIFMRKLESEVVSRDYK